MGRPIITQNTQLIKNGPFFNSNFWTPLPPWVIAGGRAHWNFDAATGANDLFQSIYAGADETYLCHFRAEITIAARTFNFKIGDVQKTFPGAFGIMDETFELTPTINGDFSLDVGIAFAPGSLLDIWNISIIGTPVGDPMYTMVNVLNMRPIGTTQTELTDLGGATQYRIAGRSDSSNCLIKTVP